MMLWLRLDDSISTSEAKKYQKNLLQRDAVNNVEYVLNQSIDILKE